MSSACSMLGHMPTRSDSEILSAIGHGQAEFGWDEWFGDIDTADYLTSVG
jgi:hypothetical protein